ncbi:hypothetical protein HYPSUDRAFT_69749 [Hypholoma sublateritium FD-334 SS-4]|uniref:Uncharacterized protein n=1 Tax=Hypholoma sublateritium (strain FD-334 SS-4) TaxID=945553 RepID=A0A0D2NIH6_HYPSF|nr:hypothetical protein HYPSUDRAFT_69749 [Hypholoma sublateritium FD-334 SS-4]
MLILLFLFALFRHLQGAPLTANEGGDIEPLPTLHILPRTDIVFGTRATSDIVTSCLATIFACTWTAIHPNIPSPADSRWDIFKRRLVTTIYALLVPEFVTGWAFRQHLGAKRIVQEYNSEIAKQTVRVEHQHGPRRPWFQKLSVGFREWLLQGPPFHPIREGEIPPWTTTHGFFVQMGGFVLSENGIPIQATSFSKSWLEKDDDISEYITKHKDQRAPCDGIKESILAGVIDAPKITKAEIEDRSKGDAISKTVVILQTTWFIAQCIARWSARISVTELEIVTLGFAMLNGITYALWWHKPQDVGVPVYLEIKAMSPNPVAMKSVATSTSDTESAIEPPHMNTETAASNEIIATPNSRENESAAPSTPERQADIELLRIDAETATPNEITEELGYLVPKNITDARLHKRSFLVRKLKEDWGPSPGIDLLFFIPYRLTTAFFHPFIKLCGASYDYVREGDLRVPMFFGEPAITNESAHFIGMIATVFGLVHLVPSFFLHDYPHTTLLLWRISAAFITVQSIFTSSVSYMRDMMMSSPSWLVVSIGLLLGVSYPLYIVARLALIILAFVSLHDLPPNAYLTIDWISSIPHL